MQQLMHISYRRPATPAAIERALRQEAGFGCARCGHPYIEYHHIIPYSEEQHFRAEDMVALCGNCHPSVSKLGRDRQYEIKDKPFNISNGLYAGALEFDKRDLLFKVGGNYYENVPTILQYGALPLISCRIDEGQAKVSLNLLGPNDRSVMRVEDNNITFRVDDLWDFEYQHNVAIARYGHRSIALRMDFRKPEAIIEGRIWVQRQIIQLGSDTTTLPGNSQFKGNRFSDCGVGISFGPSDRLPEL